MVTDNSTRQAELMSGEVDLAYNAQFDPETIRALQNRTGIQVKIGEGTNIGYLGIESHKRFAALRSKSSSGRSPRHRHRSNNRSPAQKPGQTRRGHPADFALGLRAGVKVYDYDPERAKRLLDEAGRADPDGDGPQTRFELTMMTSTTQLSRNIAAIMQDQFRRVGIYLNLQSFETATLFDRINKLQFDLYYLINIGGNQSTDIFQFVYHSRYQDPEFNDAITRLRAGGGPFGDATAA